MTVSATYYGVSFTFEEYEASCKARDDIRRIRDLDIPGVGRRRSARLIKHFETFEAFAEASPAELTEVPQISERRAKFIRQTLTDLDTDD